MAKSKAKFLDLKVDCAVDMVDAADQGRNVSNEIDASIDVIQPSGLVTEKFTRLGDGVTMNRTYSKYGKYIIQDGTGCKFIEAVDPEFLGFTYTESNEIIPNTIRR